MTFNTSITWFPCIFLQWNHETDDLQIAKYFWVLSVLILLDFPIFEASPPHSPRESRKGCWKHRTSLLSLLLKALLLTFKCWASLNIPSSVFFSSLLDILLGQFQSLMLDFNPHAHNPQICFLPLNRSWIPGPYFQCLV